MGTGRRTFKRASSAGGVAGRTAAGGRNCLPSHHIAAGDTFPVPAAGLAACCRLVRNPGPGGVGAVACLFTVFRNGAALCAAFTPVVTGIVIPHDCAPGVDVTGVRLFRRVGLFRCRHLDGVSGTYALVGDGQGFIARRAGVKATDHIFGDWYSPCAVVGVDRLNGEPGHIQRAAHCVAGFMSGAVDPDGDNGGRVDIWNSNRGGSSRLVRLCGTQTHKVGSGRKIGDLGAGTCLRVGEIRLGGVLHLRRNAEDFPVYFVRRSGSGGGQAGGGGGTVSLGDAPGNIFRCGGSIVPLIAGLQLGDGGVAAYSGLLVPGQRVAGPFLHAGLF